MVLAFELSVRLGLGPPDDAERARRHLAERGLPVGLADLSGPAWTADALFTHMLHDKKARDAKMARDRRLGLGAKAALGATEGRRAMWAAAAASAALLVAACPPPPLAPRQRESEA